jgi:hypothetical protein
MMANKDLTGAELFPEHYKTAQIATKTEVCVGKENHHSRDNRQRGLTTNAQRRPED